MSSVRSLLVAADQQARAILLDGPDPRRANGRLLSWAETLETAAHTMAAMPGGGATAHYQDADALAYASRAAASIDRDSHRGWREIQPADRRVARICALLAEAGSRLQHERPGPERAGDVSVAVLHTSWLLTHAVAISLTRHAQELRLVDPADPLADTISQLAERVRSVELVLDTRVNGRPPRDNHGQQTHEAGLAAALSTWTTTLQQVLGRQPDPRHYTVAADVNLTLMARTAGLATAGAQAGTLPSRDVHDRLVPVLENAARSWAGTRELWGALITPDTTGSRPLMQAAIGLRTALRDPGLSQRADTAGVLAAGLAASVEAAVLSRAGLIHLDLAPAVTVAALTEDLLIRNPDQAHRQFTVWKSMDSTEGRAPITVPELLKEHLLRQADQTLTSSITARSAGNLLLPTSSHAATVTFAAAKAETRPLRHQPPPVHASMPPTVGR